jgi:hypothetical protein
MRSLDELIGVDVIATIGEHDIKGKVIGYHIEDWYFEEKNEPIYITVSVIPTELCSDDIGGEELSEVPLCDIRKA